MKRCPECRRDYVDDTLLYCLEDGVALVQGSVPALSEPGAVATGFLPDDEPQTAILHDTAGVNEEATRAQVFTTDQTAVLPSGITEIPNAKSFDKRLLLAPLALALIVLVGFFGYRYTTQPNQIESVAVMPFVNDSGNADVEYLSDGMTETLIKSLSQLPNLAVKSRSTVFYYKGKETSPKKIGEDLGVQAVLLGRVGGRGDDLKLSLELVNTRTQDVIWTEQYDRKQSDLVTLQSEIAKDVSTKLKSKLSGADEAKVTKSGTVSPEAYQAYLKGRYFWNRRTAENLKRAIEQFDLSVHKDPNYALAYVGLADCYAIAGEFLQMSLKEASPKARAYATKALEIDDSLGEAYATLGSINHKLWNWAESEKAYKRSIELNPNYATARHWYSRLLAVLGRKDEALAEIKRANEIDPLSLPIMNNISQRYQEMGDYQSAIEQCRKLIEIDPSYSSIHWQLASIYLDQKRYAEALAEAEKARDNPTTTVYFGRAYAQLGRRGEALAIIRILEEGFAKGEEGAASAIASVYVELGDKERTFEWLEKALQVRDPDLLWTRIGPTFDPIRDDPRFKDLLKRMGLPE